MSLLLFLNELINIYLDSQFWLTVNISDKTNINNMSLVSSIIFKCAKYLRPSYLRMLLNGKTEMNVAKD